MDNKEIEEKLKDLDKVIHKLVEAVNSLHSRLSDIESFIDSVKEDKKFEYNLSLNQFKHRN